MPLRDHFGSPLGDDLEWGSFQTAWASVVSFDLNQCLPEGFRASPRVPRTRVHPLEESAEVLVHAHRDGRYLAGAIELVSEGNKDRAEAREAFIAKCETYLQNGAGLIIFDAVTTRSANLHDELMERIGPPDNEAWGERLYATAYRPMGKNGSARLSIWREALALGKPLPTMPLWLLHGPGVSVNLEATYEDTFRQLRLPTD